MSGTLSVLGLGSNNVLSADLLDKLKNADTKSIIKPFEQKIKNNETRQSDLNTLLGISKSLKSITSSLSGVVEYAQRDVNTKGESASITAESGSQVQSFELNVTKLALRDIHESKKFAQENSKLSAGTLDIAIDGKTYSINVEADTTLKDLKDKVFEETKGKVTASLLNVGGKDPYQFILKSTNTGAANKMTISGSSATELGLTKVGNGAQDAEVEFNGVTIKRANNSIDDLIPGVKIKLNELGKTSATITQKTSNVAEQVEKFVEKYNEFLANLQTVTSYDPESKKSGTFQGNSEMNQVVRSIKNSLAQNTNESLANFGIETKRNGELTLDKSKLNKALENDFEKTKNFFAGTTETKGLFQHVNTALEDLTVSKNGAFKSLEEELKTKSKSLTQGMKSAQERLDSKYDIMQKRFAAYDALIAKMNANFNALKSMIDAQTKK